VGFLIDLIQLIPQKKGQIGESLIPSDGQSILESWSCDRHFVDKWTKPLLLKGFVYLITTRSVLTNSPIFCVLTSNEADRSGDSRVFSVKQPTVNSSMLAPEASQVKGFEFFQELSPCW